MAKAIWEQGYTQNRELSWLQFNARVLAEAQDESVPLLERLKFLSIFTSNLDEFYMIRVGSLGDIAAVDKTGVDSKSGLTARQQLERIYAATGPLYELRDQVFNDVEQRLAEEGLCHAPIAELTPAEQKFIRHYFRTTIQPILSPQIVDSHHPFPHLGSKVTHVGALLGRKKRELLGLIPVPASLPAVVYLPENPGRYVLLEEILLSYADTVFEMYDVLEKVLFCITRNADINLDDEPFSFEASSPELDVRAKMEKLLRRRNRLSVVRLELSRPISDHFS
ncbi:MAG: RNA degradosome polyphosphate kinase, partial [Butyricicoccus sp.]